MPGLRTLKPDLINATGDRGVCICAPHVDVYRVRRRALGPLAWSIRRAPTLTVPPPPEPSSSAGPAGQRLRQAGRCTEQCSAFRRRDCVRHGRADQHDLLRDQRLASTQQRVAHSSSLLGCLQRHAHRPGLRGQQHVPLAARVLCRRVVVFLHRPQRSGSRELYADEKAFFGLP
jgi:hypothetical protein